MEKQVIKHLARGHTGSGATAGAHAQLCLLNRRDYTPGVFMLALKPHPRTFNQETWSQPAFPAFPACPNPLETAEIVHADTCPKALPVSRRFLTGALGTCHVHACSYYDFRETSLSLHVRCFMLNVQPSYSPYLPVSEARQRKPNI